MEGTWDQTVHSDAKVVALREKGEWKAAWDLVLTAMVRAHTGDRHASQRASSKTRGEFLQHGDKTVATVSQALVEENQSRAQLGLWNNIGTLIADLEKDWRRKPMLSMFGLSPTSEGDRETHTFLMGVLHRYHDVARAYELYGSLRPELQTHL